MVVTSNSLVTITGSLAVLMAQAVLFPELDWANRPSTWEQNGPVFGTLCSIQRGPNTPNDRFFSRASLEAGNVCPVQVIQYPRRSSTASLEAGNVCPVQ